MEQVQITLVLSFISFASCVLGDAMAVFPPEARNINQFQYYTPLQHFRPLYKNAVPQEVFMFDEPVMPLGSMEPQETGHAILHTTAGNSPPVSKIPESLNLTGHETSRAAVEEEHRAAKGGYDYSSHGSSSYPTSPSYGYSSPATGSSYPASSTSHTYSPPATPTSPSYSPAPTHHSTPDKFFKSDLSSLIKPVSMKAASKVSGLIGLVLSLFSGSGDDFEMKGFKDIVINGIVKPLLVAKGGIKSLISKLTIPVIALLLINLEVLVVVWWLWEDCEEAKPTYDYSKPTNKPYSPTSSYAPSSYPPASPNAYAPNSYN